MSEQVVFDYSVGSPYVINDTIEERMQDAKDRGDSVYESFRDAELQQLKTNPQFESRLKEEYDRSGMTLTSPTVSSGAPLYSFERELDRWQAKFDHLEWLHKATSPASARQIAREGEVAVILNTQHGDDHILGTPKQIESLYNSGIRIFQLTYNLQNRLGTGCKDRSDGGLSNYGLDALEHLNEIGAIVDLSHCGTETTLDGIEHSDSPVAITHAACEHVLKDYRGEHGGSEDVPEPDVIAAEARAKSDEELELLAENDGYLGIVAVPWFITPYHPDLPFEALFDHIEHAVSKVGINNVGIGTDFTHIDANAPELYLSQFREWAYRVVGVPEGYGGRYGNGWGRLQSYRDFQVIRRGLADRFTDEEADMIMGENFISFWERVVN